MTNILMKVGEPFHFLKPWLGRICDLLNVNGIYIVNMSINLMDKKLIKTLLEIIY